MLLLGSGLQRTRASLQDLLTVETDGYNYWVDVPRHEPRRAAKTCGSCTWTRLMGTTRGARRRTGWERFVKGRRPLATEVHGRVEAGLGLGNTKRRLEAESGAWVEHIS